MRLFVKKEIFEGNQTRKKNNTQVRGELQPSFLCMNLRWVSINAEMSIKTSFGKFGKLMAKKAKKPTKKNFLVLSIRVWSLLSSRSSTSVHVETCRDLSETSICISLGEKAHALFFSIFLQEPFAGHEFLKLLLIFFSLSSTLVWVIGSSSVGK